MVHRERVELSASWFVARRSIQMSYRCMKIVDYHLLLRYKVLPMPTNKASKATESLTELCRSYGHGERSEELADIIGTKIDTYRRITGGGRASTRGRRGYDPSATFTTL